jgi:Fe2+ or Zn2+ uptake regulation protein
MPIKNSEWDSGKRTYPLREKILFFLRNNSDKALNIKEIVEGTGYSIQVVLQGYGDAPESQFRSTLDALVEEGFIEIRSINNGKELYYKATEKANSNIPAI